MSYSNTVTKEDLKNVLNEVLPQSKYIQSWEYVGDVYWWSSTWTVPDDGFIEVYVEPSAANWYWRISDSLAPDTGWSHRLTGANGLTVSQEFFVKKGAVFSTSSMSAVSTAHVYYYKFTLKETTPSSAADYIVEQGTSGIWTYRKWASGIAECWGRAENNSIPSGWSTTGVNLALPFIFKTMKNWQIQHQNYQVSNCYGYPTTISNTYDNINIQTNASAAMSTATFMILCQGTWK